MDFWISPGVSLLTEYNVSAASDMNKVNSYHDIEASGSTYEEVLENQVGEKDEGRG